MNNTRFSTLEEQKELLTFETKTFYFHFKRDLSSGIQVISKEKQHSRESLSQEVAQFTNWWASGIRTTLHSFIGFENVEFTFNNNNHD